LLLVLSAACLPRCTAHLDIAHAPAGRLYRRRTALLLYLTVALLYCVVPPAAYTVHSACGFWHARLLLHRVYLTATLPPTRAMPHSSTAVTLLHTRWFTRRGAARALPACMRYAHGFAVYTHLQRAGGLRHRCATGLFSCYHHFCYNIWFTATTSLRTALRRCMVTAAHRRSALPTPAPRFWITATVTHLRLRAVRTLVVGSRFTRYNIPCSTPARRCYLPLHSDCHYTTVTYPTAFTCGLPLGSTWVTPRTGSATVLCRTLPVCRTPGCLVRTLPPLRSAARFATTGSTALWTPARTFGLPPVPAPHTPTMCWTHLRIARYLALCATTLVYYALPHRAHFPAHMILRFRIHLPACCPTRCAGLPDTTRCLPCWLGSAGCVSGLRASPACLYRTPHCCHAATTARLRCAPALDITTFTWVAVHGYLPAAFTIAPRLRTRYAQFPVGYCPAFTHTVAFTFTHCAYTLPDAHTILPTVRLPSAWTVRYGCPRARLPTPFYVALRGSLHTPPTPRSACRTAAHWI